MKKETRETMTGNRGNTKGNRRNTVRHMWKHRAKTVGNSEETVETKH